MVLCLLGLVIQFRLGILSFAGVLGVIALLAYEHKLVNPHDLSRLNAAFFTVNSYVSVLFFAFGAADILLKQKPLL
jgi:4-hydroxybenzoate polyprenyltransferase